MKTRFSSLVTVKKVITEKEELRLGQIDQQLREIASKIETLYASLQTLATPDHGVVSLLYAAKLQADLLRQQIHFSQQEKIIVESHRQAQYEKVIAARLDCERIVHLEKEEQAMIMAQKTLRDQRALDEVGLLLHARRSS